MVTWDHPGKMFQELINLVVITFLTFTFLGAMLIDNDWQGSVTWVGVPFVIGWHGYCFIFSLLVWSAPGLIMTVLSLFLCVLK